jgi:hypothetical protein
METKKRAAGFAEAVREMELTPEDEARLEARKEQAAGRGFGSVEELDEAEAAAEKKATEDPDPLTAAADDPGEEEPGIPPWVMVPEGFSFPRGGRQVGFMRFPSEWTTRPDAGVAFAGPEHDKLARDGSKTIKYKMAGKLHRQCILWSLSVADEKLARAAARGDSLALYEELAKRTIRAIDGRVPDRDKGDLGEVSVKRFWEEIGPAFRQAIVNYYHRTHTLTDEQAAHFLVFGLAVRSAVTG